MAGLSLNPLVRRGWALRLFSHFDDRTPDILLQLLRSNLHRADMVLPETMVKDLGTTTDSRVEIKTPWFLCHECPHLLHGLLGSTPITFSNCQRRNPTFLPTADPEGKWQPAYSARGIHFQLRYWILDWPWERVPKICFWDFSMLYQHPHESWLSPQPHRDTLNHLTMCLQLTSLTHTFQKFLEI